MLILPLTNFTKWTFVQTNLKLKISLKTAWNPSFDKHSPISTQFTVQTIASSGRSYAEWYGASIEPIKRFLASHYSRRDSETWRLLDFRVSTNLTDTFIFSQKTYSSVLPKPGARPRRAGCLTARRMFDRTEQDKDMTGQGRTWQNEDRTGCCPWIQSFWYFGRLHHSFSIAHLSN